MAEEPSWTLDELVGQIAAALAGAAYPGSPNGRVRDLPDRRAVRWYTTTGIVDRPVMRGRTAFYGTRHLLQVVAVKRLQAQGLSLAQIQADLTGATDRTLSRIAAVPDETRTAELGGAKPTHQLPAPTGRRNRFWTEPPAEPPAEAAANGADTVTALTAVSLPGGALLLLPAQPGDDDLQAIRAAAAPLLTLLAERGLIPLDERSPS